MVARGLLANPAMFSGYQHTPVDCIKNWVDVSLRLGTPFTCFHNHLIYMMDKIVSKSEKRFFNSLQSTPAVLEYLNSNVYPYSNQLSIVVMTVLFRQFFYYYYQCFQMYGTQKIQLVKHYMCSIFITFYSSCYEIIKVMLNFIFLIKLFIRIKSFLGKL